jgi:hypothetical protein
MVEKNNINSLIIAGCSFSDWSEVEYNYGEYLGQNLNLPVRFYTSGVGSNFRIWRRLTKAILNKEITSKDLLVIQYTNVDRKEFWSAHSSPSDSDYKPSGNPIKGSPMRDKYLDGDIIKFKVGASQWQPIKIERTFFEMIEENFTSEDFDNEIFINYNVMFQSFLKEFKIPAIFLRTHYISMVKQEIPIIDCDFHYYLDVREVHTPELSNESAMCHLNDDGHQKLASILTKYINTNIK